MRSDDAGSTTVAESSSTSAAPTKGQWQSLGVDPLLAKSLTLRGFKIPTPIQRATLPHTLSTPPHDVLGMARTGSGKTLAYLIPLLQRLRAVKDRQSSSRALILVPTRELALQVLRAGKDVSRGIKINSPDGKRALRWAMIIGGDPLDKQFELMVEQPDIVIATPGRFLHVVIEMKHSLLDVSTVVYDEADRLFELGFQVQLQEILSRLPTSRQSMLFSATLPSSVAEFVRAGLQNPTVIRLDADVKINPDLLTYFLRVNTEDKEAALLLLLDYIAIPTNTEPDMQSPQAIIFVATKHHVEYISALLQAASFPVAHVYGSLDQVARQRQLQSFRDRKKSVLVVTDVAARGLDIPIMDHVINFDFPPNPRVFVHRVGRTARGGRKGTAWSLLDKEDLPYFADLSVHLESTSTKPDLYRLPRTPLEAASETLRALSSTAPDIVDLRTVMRKGDAMYKRSRSKASPAGYRSSRAWRDENTAILPIAIDANGVQEDTSRQGLIDVLSAFRPSTTGITAAPRGVRKGKARGDDATSEQPKRSTKGKRGEGIVAVETVEIPQDQQSKKDFRDSSFFMEHAQKDDGNKMYTMAEPSASQTISASILDLQGDEQLSNRPQRASQLRWDRKTKRFKREGQQDGTAGPMIKTESGALLPATFDSGRFREWNSKRRSQVDSNSSTNKNRTKESSRNHGELRSATEVHRSRDSQIKRKAKNARTPRKTR